jgi:hypothetical protein
MGNLYDYFSAPDDAAAATTFDGGPGAAGFPTLDVKGIDPFLQLGGAEALLLGRPVEVVIGHPRAGHLVSESTEDCPWVVTLTDEFRDALAAATPDVLAEVALPWSRTEEFGEDCDPEPLADFLGRLAELARGAREGGHRLYCWISL